MRNADSNEILSIVQGELGNVSKILDDLAVNIMLDKVDNSLYDTLLTCMYYVKSGFISDYDVAIKCENLLVLYNEYKNRTCNFIQTNETEILERYFE